MKAQDFLQAGLGHMQDRAATYDKPTGERSMAATVGAFKSVCGVSITEEQGWLFMGLLKMVRSQQGEFKADNYEDEAAYAALRGECAFAARSGDTASPVSFEDRIEEFKKSAGDKMQDVLSDALAPYKESAGQFLNTVPVADADGWIKWDCGECPVIEGLLVDIEDRSGEQWIAQCPVKECDWRHSPGRKLNSDIIAYRIHKAGE